MYHTNLRTIIYFKGFGVVFPFNVFPHKDYFSNYAKVNLNIYKKRYNRLTKPLKDITLLVCRTDSVDNISTHLQCKWISNSVCTQFF